MPGSQPGRPNGRNRGTTVAPDRRGVQATSLRAMGHVGSSWRTFHSCCSYSVARRCGIGHELEALGFTWAYAWSTHGPSAFPNVVNVSSPSLPLGRPSTRAIRLLTQGRIHAPFSQSQMCGFYWTEGLRGLGWAVDAVPTLKGDPRLGFLHRRLSGIRKTARSRLPICAMQNGYRDSTADWTAPAADFQVFVRGHRWKLVGNAVSVPLRSGSG